MTSWILFKLKLSIIIEMSGTLCTCHHFEACLMMRLSTDENIDRKRQTKKCLLKRRNWNSQSPTYSFRGIRLSPFACAMTNSISLHFQSILILIRRRVPLITSSVLILYPLINLMHPSTATATAIKRKPTHTSRRLPPSPHNYCLHINSQIVIIEIRSICNWN